MSKKQIDNRIKNLFASLEDETLPPQNTPQAAAGWTWECDSAGIYLTCSPEITACLGYTPAELIGQRFLQFGLLPGDLSSLEAALKTGPFPLESRLTFLSKQGKQVECSLEIYPIPWPLHESEGSPVLYGWRGIQPPAV